MQSSGDSYHVEINGIAEGPMTVRDLVWKIGMAGNDDVIRFRQEGSGDWQPLEGNRERLQQLASAEPGQAAAPASPPKLKLKRRGDAPSPSGNETPPPFPSEPPTPPTSLDTPPPPPGAPGSPEFPEVIEYTDDNPPPPPGAPGYQPIPPLPPATPPPVPQFNPGTQAPPSAPNKPQPPPVRITTLLTVSFIITVGLVGYIFFLMPQDVVGSAKRKTETSYSREVSGLFYAVLTRSQAEEWKTASLEKLAAFGSKARAEAEASAGRSLTLNGSTREIIAKYTAAARALSMAGINAKHLSSGFDPNSSRDIKALRSLELAMEIAEAYLPPECRGDVEGRRFPTVVLAVRGVGFTNLKSAFDAEILTVENRLKAELAQIKPTADAGKGLTRKTMYEVPTEIIAVARGTSDNLGRFDLRLAPGDYVVVASADPLGTSPGIEWARRFKVKALTENSINLDDTNRGTKGEGTLWKAEETSAIERDIAAAVEQAGRLDATLSETQKLRADIEELKVRVGRLLDN
jgi:hypothetical protein